MVEKLAWLEMMLQRKQDENCFVNILSVDETYVTKKGDNYLSDLKRIQIVLLLRNGKKSKKSFIIKTEPSGELMQKFARKMMAFKREILMYKDILPAMEDILIEFNDHTEPMWAKMIHYKAYDQLVIDDLTESGYKLANRKLGLDLQHALLVIRSLAKFHAASLIIKDRGLIGTDMFDKYVYSFKDDKSMILGIYKASFNKLLTTMESNWGPEWQTTVTELRQNVLPKISDILSDIVRYKEDQFNVLNHGDLWINNVLFKYGLDSVTPISVKFIDLQMSYFNSPIIDLHYLLSTSLELNVRKTSIEQLLKIYHETLIDQLALYSYQGHIITYDQLKLDFDKNKIYGLLAGATSLPYLYREDNDDSFPEMGQIVENIINGSATIPSCVHPLYELILKELVSFSMK